MPSFTLPVPDLKTALERVKPAIAKSNPVFHHVLIVRSDGETTFVTTDITLRATHRIPSPYPTPVSELSRRLLASRCERENAIALLNFAELVAVLKGADKRFPVRFDIEPGKLEASVTATYGGTEVTRPISGRDPIEFPEDREAGPYETKMIFDAATRRSFFRAYATMSQDETRYVLNGVYLDGSQPSHCAVATDGRRLVAANSITIPPAGSGIIIPRLRIFDGKLLRDFPWTLTFRTWLRRRPDWLERAQKLRVRTTDPARLKRIERYEKTRMEIECEGTRYAFDPVDGRFPNWRQVIPGDSEYAVSVPLTQMCHRKILEAVPALPAEKEGVRIHIDKAEVSIQAGNTAIPLSAPRWLRADAKPITLGVNRNFLTQAAAFGMKEVRFIDDMAPMLFSDENANYVVMPMRITQEEPKTPEPGDADDSEDSADSED